MKAAWGSKLMHLVIVQHIVDLTQVTLQVFMLQYTKEDNSDSVETPVRAFKVCQCPPVE